MNICLLSTKRLMCSAILLASLCLTASAQSINPTPGTPSAAAGTCVPFNATNYSYTFTPQSGTSQAVTIWFTTGDLTITSNPTFTNTVTVSSSGLARGRLYASYSSGPGCGSTTSYTVNKVFTPADFATEKPLVQIVGPSSNSCVEAGSRIAFSIEPVLSSAAQIALQIGVDTYAWNFGAAGSAPYYPLYSGDGSAVQITAPSTPFTASVVIGSCNAATGPHRTSITYGTKPPKPTISGAPSCLLTSAVGSANAFNLSINNTVVGVDYRWILPPGWTTNPASATSPTGIPGNGGTQTISVIPGTSGAVDISVIASLANGCDATPSNPVRISRQLASSITLIAPTTCITPGSQVTVSIPTPPANTLFQWTLPAGWSFAPGTLGNEASVNLIAGGPSGIVRASAVGCPITPSLLTNPAVPGELSTPTLNVSGPNGCAANTYSIDRFGSANRYFELSTTSTNPLCLPSGPGVTYTWTADNNPAPANSVQPGSSILFPNPVPRPGNVTVVIRDANNCRQVTITSLVQRMVLTSQTTDPILVDMASYPNPAGDELNVDLNSKGAAVKLTLTDMLGRTVQEKVTTKSHTKLDVKGLPVGTYTLRATLPNGKSAARFVQVTR
jgi:hypothetical protein